MTITPQEIASEFQRLVNRLENAEGALKGLGRFEYETCHAFVSRFLKAHDERFLRLIDERDAALTRAEKAEAERDDQKARADRNHHERTTFRVENDALRAEVARLRKEQKYDLNKNAIAWKDFDTLKANVDAAFKTLGKRDDESYEACAARMMEERKWAVETQKAALESQERLAAEVRAARATTQDVTDALAKMNNEYAVLAKERDAARDTLVVKRSECDEWRRRYYDMTTARDEVAVALQRVREDLVRAHQATRNAAMTSTDAIAGLAQVAQERDAARAELAKVREALGTLMNEGKKAP